MQLRVLVVVCVALAARDVSAQKSTDDRARVHFDAGREHYDNGRYEAAVGEFEAAYAVSPKPELRYNLYLAHERLGQFEQALAHLEAYLAAATIEPAERARLESRRDALKVRAAPGPVDAEVEPAATVEARAERHHSGFVARLALGIGYARAETDAYRIAGGIGDLTLTAGWMLTDTLALHGTIWGASMAGASITSKALDLTFEDEESRYAALAVGIGGTLHLPAQFFLSLSVGAAGISQEAGGRQTESEIGGAALALAGKEWSLSDSWTAGIALGFSFFSIPGKVDATLGERDNPASVFMLSILGTIAFD